VPWKGYCLLGLSLFSVLLSLSTSPVIKSWGFGAFFRKLDLSPATPPLFQILGRWPQLLQLSLSVDTPVSPFSFPLSTFPGCERRCSSLLGSSRVPTSRLKPSPLLRSAPSVFKQSASAPTFFFARVALSELPSDSQLSIDPFFVDLFVSPRDILSFSSLSLHLPPLVWGLSLGIFFFFWPFLVQNSLCFFPLLASSIIRFPGFPE